METKTGFDLNAAVGNWRKELAQLGLADNQQELEAHLRDTIVELRRCDLNDEEAFWLARRRMGKPAELAEEFAKADPARVWRMRVFWIVTGLLGFELWQRLLSGPWMFAWVTQHPLLPEWIRFYLPLWLDNFLNSFLFRMLVLTALNVLPVLWICVYVVKGRMVGARLWRFLLQSRLHLGLSAFVALFLVQGLLLGWRYALPAQFARTNLASVSAGAIWPLTLVAIMIWLMPMEAQEPKHA